MEKCGYCTFLNPDKVYESWDKKYWCEEHHEWKYADEEGCYRFCRAYGRSSSVSDSLISASRDSQNSSSGCGLSTILCTVLGMADDNPYLETFREFRNNILQREPKYFGILAQYDILGPKISKHLCNDSDRLSLSKVLFESCIKPIVARIKDCKYDDAIRIYTEMTERLLEYYKIKTQVITQQMIDSMDIEKSGHGKLMLKEKLC